MPNIYVHKKVLLFIMRFITNIQQQVRNFFGASTTEVNAFLILLPLMIFIMILSPFYHHIIPAKKIDISEDKAQLEQFITALKSSQQEEKPVYNTEKKINSPFDPNNAPFNILIKAGLDTIIAARIIKFRNSGGKFKFKEDLHKIYELKKETYESIAAKISLPSKPVAPPAGDAQIPAEVAFTSASKNPKKEKEFLIFNVNEADSLTLSKIKGIGPVLSSRIIRYREILGGFIDTLQFKEVYGLKTEVLKQLYATAVIEENFNPIVINVNKADAPQLARHPYISWTIAKAIVAYRQQHGSFLTLDELQRIKLIDQKTFKKIKPYLSV